MSRIQFRWWYFLLLLPLLGYLGARLYVDNRIQSAIAAANTDGNELVVGRYAFSLVPLGISVDSVRFEQDRTRFSATGRLASASLRGVSLADLIGGGRLGLGDLEVTGLDAEITTKNADTTGSGSGRDYQLDRILVSDSRLRLIDPAAGREVLASNWQLDHRNLRTPFTTGQLGRTLLTLDSLEYTESGSGTHVLLLQPELEREASSLNWKGAEARRSGGAVRFDLALGRLELEQPDFDSLGSGKLLADRLAVAALSGQIELDSSRTSDTENKDAFLRLAEVSFPEVDLEVNGGFGRAVVRGGEWEQAALVLPITKELPGSSGVRADSVYLSVPRGELSLEGMVYTTGSDELRTSAGTMVLANSPSRAGWDQLTVTGVPRDALLRGETPLLGSVSIQAFRWGHTNAQRSRFDGYASKVTANDIELGETPRLAGVTLSGAWLKRYDPAGRLRLHVAGLTTEQGAIDLKNPVENPGTTRLSARQVLLVDEDGAADYCFVDIDYNSATGRLTLDSILRRSARPIVEILRTTEEKSVLEFTLGGLKVAGVDRAGFLSQRLGRIQSIEGNSFNLRVIEDPAKPRSPGYRALPVEALRKLPLPLAVDRVRLADVHIKYAILSETYEPKEIHFREGRAAVNNFDTRVSATDSIEVTCAFSFQGVAPLSARFALSRSASGRDYGMSGSLGRYDLTDINPLMDVAARVTVESGIVNSMRYRADMRENTIRGDMRFLYEELDVSPQGALGLFKNLAASMVVKNNNVAGEEYRAGTMYFESDESRNFFNGYWQGLVTGMKSSALSNIILPDELENENR